MQVTALYRFRSFPGVVVIVLILASLAGAKAKEKVLLRFNYKDGAYPSVDLISDQQGNLYGTASNGRLAGKYCGYYGCGAVFELSPASGGGWKYSLLYSFKGYPDAGEPTSRLLLDNKGNLYGAALVGPELDGVVFQLTPQASGPWKETIIHAFPTGTDGTWPTGDLAMDANGNLYGSTRVGGYYGGGVVYELTPQQNGSWAETVLHQFGQSGDGEFEYGGVVLDAKGNLYGATYQGGSDGAGTVFQLSSTGNGGWNYSIIYNFSRNGSVGQAPYYPLTVDSQGNLYGVTSQGGPNYDGTVFELSQSPGGTWQMTAVYDFPDSKIGPPRRVVFDNKGDILGATSGGGNGCYGGCGVVWELKSLSGGGWQEIVFHNFQSGDDGSRPAGVLIGNDGNLYGPTTYGGGMYGYGTLYEIVP